MKYSDVYDLPTLDEYYLQELEVLSEAEIPFKREYHKILKKVVKRYLQDFDSLPECKFMLKKTRRNNFLARKKHFDRK